MEWEQRLIAEGICDTALLQENGFFCHFPLLVWKWQLKIITAVYTLPKMARKQGKECHRFAWSPRLVLCLEVGTEMLQAQ